MTEEKDPQVWSSFYDATTAKIKAWRDQRESDAIRRTMASTGELFDLQDKVEAGAQAKVFVEGDFWKFRLQPFLRSKAVLKPCNLNDTTPSLFDKNFMVWVEGSGAVKVMTSLIDQLNRWQMEGEEADKKLRLEAEKRNRVDKRAVA